MCAELPLADQDPSNMNMCTKLSWNEDAPTLPSNQATVNCPKFMWYDLLFEGTLTILSVSLIVKMVAVIVKVSVFLLLWEWTPAMIIVE